MAEHDSVSGIIPSLGFIGLGNMGAPMAANILAGGFAVTVYDRAGTEVRAPQGAVVADTIEDLTRAAEVVFASVPDAVASEDVARAVLQTPGRKTRAVVDLSTIGIEASEAIALLLADNGIDYVDAPVSGGRIGAERGSITVMWSGSQGLLETLTPVLESFSGAVFCVGPNPGQGQTVKLINNFLSAIAMTATSEAMTFGESKGLDLQTMLDVINVSTGRNSATSVKFPERIATGTFDAGFHMALMAKDVALYHEAVRKAGAPARLADVDADYWKQGLVAFPDGDFTEIYKLIKRSDR